MAPGHEDTKQTISDNVAQLHVCSNGLEFRMCEPAMDLWFCMKSASQMMCRVQTTVLRTIKNPTKSLECKEWRTTKLWTCIRREPSYSSDRIATEAKPIVNSAIEKWNGQRRMVDKRKNDWHVRSALALSMIQFIWSLLCAVETIGRAKNKRNFPIFPR